MNEQLNKLNCMNYQVNDSDDQFWYACNGLRSLYRYSQNSNMGFKELCTKMLETGQVTLTRNEEEHTLTMI